MSECIELTYAEEKVKDMSRKCVLAIEHFETWDHVWEHPTHDSEIQQILYLPIEYKCWGKGK
ncbi:hypothetical protein ACIQFL_28735 [Bacillus toyonensis]|uniref:Uncharacterized protein n=1 Tax=Bacillus paranthracis TaxID=2026186 RepID=A0AAJ1K730_9BACI|nr:hypothetical protein [Bacillus paranthracis]MDG0950000.1 hypothetical protein [Bacillus paranthracis]MDG0955897.1 hypothetical protein [Bacillus paranthracis]